MQGIFTEADGTFVRGLVTLPCRSIGSVAHARVSPGIGENRVPPGKNKVRKAVEADRAYHQVEPQLDIDIVIDTTIPMGVGMGSSTADITATLRSLDQAFGTAPDSRTHAHLSLKAEAASDSTMFSNTVKLFAQRVGRVIEDYDLTYMPLTIVGFNLMPQECFNIDETPAAEYDPDEVLEFDALRAMLRNALDWGNSRCLGEIATRSALINQKKFPKPGLENLLRMGRDSGASGICVSHSGTVAGLLFGARSAPTAHLFSRLVSDGTDCGFEPLGLFRI